MKNFFVIIFISLFFIIFFLFNINIDLSKGDLNYDLNPETNLFSSEQINQLKDIKYNSGFVQSPILFALPTVIGFSKELDNITNDVELIFVKSYEKEKYFDFSDDYDIGDLEKDLKKEPMNLSKIIIPKYDIININKSYDNVKLSKNLEERIIDNIDFDNQLNLNNQKPYFIQAILHLTEDGFIENIFIEECSSDLDRKKIINQLYKINFKSGISEIGWIKIFNNT